MKSSKKIIPITLFSFFIILLNGCELFQNEDGNVYGDCDKELVRIVNEKGFVRVIAIYKMEYTPYHLLNEQERIEQDEAIAKLHEKLLNSMKGLNFSGVKKLQSSPWIVMSLNDKKSLKFLCQNDLIREVEKNEAHSLFK